LAMPHVEPPGKPRKWGPRVAGILVERVSFDAVLPEHLPEAGGALASALADAEEEETITIDKTVVPIDPDARARGLGGGKAVAMFLMGIAAVLGTVDWDACDRASGNPYINSRARDRMV
jgi:hypothetical protein